MVPGATVVIKNLGTNAVRTVTSNASGGYAINLLPVGHYSVTVTAPGFKKQTTADLSVEAGDRATADEKLQLGASTETVDVQATTPLLQADNATVSSTVTAQAVQDLPLNGRNFVQLVQIVPGANEGPGNGLTSGGRPDDRRSSASFSVNGQDDTLNNYVIDGVDNNERVIGTIGVKPNVEGIQEITVQTNSYSPEAGRTAGGVVNIVTRSGTNRFHGSAYEFFRNDVFDARNALQTTGRKPELRQNQYGGSIGGPIFKNKTFFFVDYEGFRQVSGVTYSSTVPTLAQYNEINSIGGATPAQLIASGNNGTNTVIDNVALNYLKLFPAPNAGAAGATSNNYIVSPNRTQYSNVFDARVDHNFNSRNNIFVRYTYNKTDTNTPQALGTAPNGIQVSGGRYIFAGPATDKAQQYEAAYTHIFNDHLVMDLRAAYTRVNNLSLPLNYGSSPDTTVGFGPNMNFNTLSNFLTPVGIGGFNDLGDGAYVPLQDIDNTYQYLGNVSYTVGNHSMKFGVSYIRRQARNVQSAFAAGQYGFGLATDACAPGTGYNAAGSGCTTAATSAQTLNNDLASTLAGAFTFVNRNYDLAPPDYRTFEPSAFAQDSWKVNQKLTLVYGLRYDIFTPFTEAHGRISNFDYDQALTSTAGTIANALKVANVNGASSTAGISTFYGAVAPRVGFSSQVRPGTVLRGGYGLSFFPGNYTSNADLKNAPFVSVYSPNCEATVAFNIQTSKGLPGSQQVNCASVTGANTTFDAGTPLPAAQTINSPALSFTAERSKFRPALIQQFNLQVEQQFGANVLTIGYVGNTGQHLPEEINDINVPSLANVRATINSSTPAPRPLAGLLPNLNGVSELQSEGISNYNALQTSFQRRFSKGLAFDANYTFGKALSDVTGFSEEGQEGWSNADPTNIGRYEYGVAENDIEHRFALSLNYEIARDHHFTGISRYALGGWSVNTITVWQSGKPFSIVNSGAAGGFSNRASPVYNGGSDRPNQIRSARLSHPTLQRYFDTTAFVPQALGTVGTAQRNSLFGPHFRHIDLSLFKDFPIHEQFKLQFRAEAFDITNTPNYYIQNNGGNGSTQLGNANFGVVSQVDPNYVPRELQFALKLQF